MEQNIPQIIWLGGLPGSGTNAVKSLLDNHPDILCFPLELSRMFRFYNSGFYGIEHHPWEQACKLLMEWFEDLTFSEYNRLGTAKLEFSFDRLQADILNWGIERKVKFNLANFIKALYESTRSQVEKYKNREPKYFCILVTSCDFPWQHLDLMKSGMHLVPYRAWSTIYEVHRNVYLSQDGWSLAKYVVLKAIRYRAQLKRAMSNLRLYGSASNFYTFNFEKLRTQCESEMKKIAHWLQIVYQPSMLYLSVLGVGDDGCMSDKSHTGQQVSPRPSRYYFPLTPFEVAFQERGHVADIETYKARQPVRHSFSKMLSLAYQSARRVAPYQLSKSIRFKYSGEHRLLDKTKIFNRDSFIKELIKHDVMPSEVELKFKVSFLSCIRASCARVVLFISLFITLILQPIAPKPKDLGITANLLMRARLFFIIKRLYQRIAS